MVQSKVRVGWTARSILFLLKHSARYKINKRPVMTTNCTYSGPTRGVTQRELYEKSDKKVVKDIVSRLVELIDTTILAAHDAGFCTITYELPVSFGISNMNKQDAQIMVYSELILVYKLPETQGGRGFPRVNIAVDGVKPYLKIGWEAGFDDNERKTRVNIINENRIKHC